ncbi:MAG: PAS-domain containing protein [Alphaproteobacteria bacterium]|nr:PAS-domain containing protein [Alphaproteobacteria bacterium]MCW5743674.1 PAS-domain containing protein [Alphaproteobacteria bacterium]
MDDPLFEALSEGVCVLDAQRRIVRHNRRFLEVCGLPAEVVKPGERLGAALDWLTSHGEFATPAQREEIATSSAPPAPRPSPTAASGPTASSSICAAGRWRMAGSSSSPRT